MSVDNVLSTKEEEQELTLLSLPHDILYKILSLLSFSERTGYCSDGCSGASNLMLVSKSFYSILTDPDFLLERRASGASEELLVLLGGKCPFRENSVVSSLSTSTSSSAEAATPTPPAIPQRRMVLKDSRTIWAYHPLQRAWKHVVGPPRMLAYLQEVTKFHSLYLGHPYYTLAFLGGVVVHDADVTDRVAAFSFLTGKWEEWPPMLRRRTKQEFFAAYANNSIIVAECGTLIDPLVGDDIPNNVDVVLEEGEEDDVLPPPDGLVGVQCDIFDLNSKQWRRGPEPPISIPSCDEGGAVVLDDRFIYIPRTSVSPSTAVEAAAAAAMVSDDSDDSMETSSVEDNNNQIDARQFAERPQQPRRGPFPRYAEEQVGLVYDTTRDSWSTLPLIPGSPTYKSMITSHEGKVIVMGGCLSTDLPIYRSLIPDYEDHVNSCWSFDPGTDEWTQLPSLPISVRGGISAVYQDKLTLLGGLAAFSQTFHSDSRKYIWQYDASCRSWRRASSESTRDVGSWKETHVSAINLPMRAWNDGFACSVIL